LLHDIDHGFNESAIGVAWHPTVSHGLEVSHPDTSGCALVEDVFALMDDTGGFVLPAATGVTTIRISRNQWDVRQLGELQKAGYCVPRLEDAVVYDCVDDEVDRLCDNRLDAIPDSTNVIYSGLEAILKGV